MILLGDEAQVEARFVPFGDSANLDANGCIVYAEHTIGSKIILDAPDGTVLVLVQDRCMVCAKRTIGSEIVSDADDGTPRCCGSCGIMFWSVPCRC
jgi:hypothetical protein